MHVPLKLVTEVVQELCTKCHSNMYPVLRVSVFGQSGLVETPPVCVGCTSNVEHTLEFEEPEVELPSKRKSFKKNKRLSQKQEIEIAEELGGHVQKNSGAVAGSKGDVRVKGKYRIEAKFTAAESYKLELDDLYKIMSECGGGEKPVFVVDFLDKATKKLHGRFGILPWEDLKELIDGSINNR